MCCRTREPQCTACIGQQPCDYRKWFESPRPAEADRLRGQEQVLNGFVLARARQEAQKASLELRLYGEAVNRAELFLRGLRRAGEFGLGARHLRLECQSIWQATQPDQAEWREVIQAIAPNLPLRPAQWKGPVRVEFLSPVRLQKYGRPLPPSQFTFLELFRNLIRRVSNLAYFYGNLDLHLDFAGLLNLAAAVPRMTLRMQPEVSERYSTRQKRGMRLDALSGWAQFGLDSDSPLWPWLWLGQMTLVGRSTSMGFGEYELSPGS